MSCSLAWRHELLSSTCRFAHTVRIETSRTIELRTTRTQTAMLRRRLRPAFASGDSGGGASDSGGAASDGVGLLTSSSPLALIARKLAAIVAPGAARGITPSA